MALVLRLVWWRRSAGASPIFARGSSRTGGTFLTLFYVEIIATLGMLALNLPLGLISFAHATPGMVALAIVINLAILGGAARATVCKRCVVAAVWVRPRSSSGSNAGGNLTSACDRPSYTREGL